MTHLLRISDLKAQPNRPPEYLADALAAGRQNGEFIEISEKAYLDLVAKYRGPQGLGDVLSALASPIAKAIDATFGTDLKDCGGCASRQQALNEAFPLTDKQ